MERIVMYLLMLIRDTELLNRGDGINRGLSYELIRRDNQSLEEPQEEDSGMVLGVDGLVLRRVYWGVGK